ncbi:MAG: 2-oxo acid dehydrogenase subunit E2 [Gemmataceae bacterium]|nr:2-oxo acid dehydrogenase subunit E2 [Gemmataceae bacterium]
MTVEIQIPRLGWNMEQGVFLGWLKNEGDLVRAGEPLFTLEGDKAAQEIEALETGVLRLASKGPKEGETVLVGAVIGRLETTAAPTTQEHPVTFHPLALPAASPSQRWKARQVGIDSSPLQPSQPGERIPVAVLTKTVSTQPVRETGHPVGRPAVTPRARRAAKQLGIDPYSLPGSGANGRVRERDVLPTGKETPPPGVEYFPLSPVRKTIAQRLSQSLQSTVPVTLTMKVDATALVALRENLKAQGTAPSYNDILLRICARVLPGFPPLNARWENDRLAVFKEAHIGLAVDTDYGLVVPVVSNAGGLSLGQISERTRELIAKARNRSLKGNETSGGTFTLTSLGSFGIDAFTPIINWPETAILGVGRIVLQPAVVAGQIVAQHQLTLSLTFDHRAVDGAYAARFLQALAAAEPE